MARNSAIRVNSTIASVINSSAPKSIQLKQVRDVAAELAPFGVVATTSSLTNFLQGFSGRYNPQITTPAPTTPRAASNSWSLSTKYTTALSMQGGGFRAMTAVEGMIGGALSYFRGLSQSSNRSSLQNFLNNVGTITGNSGATWFLSLLGFSSDFVNQVENNSLFSSSGYMTKLNAAYNSYMSGLSTNPTWSQFTQLIRAATGSETLTRLLNIYENIGTADWNKFLSGTVFAPVVNGRTAADLLKGTNFYSSSGSSSRTTALSNQAMVFTTAIATDRAAIGNYTVNALGIQLPTGNVTQATVTNARQNTNLTPTNSSGAGTSQSYFIESNATSAAADSTVIAAPLPSIGTNSNGYAQTINVTYSTTNINPLPGTSASSSSTTINNLNFNGISAFAATAQSSSAIAALGSDGPLQSTSARLIGQH